ncbi:MAG: phospho-sugar mutase, partial [Lachnospiraceae bacterium]|nr:phospho-sugar mutase [Lachnospiraceae bacterium]
DIVMATDPDSDRLGVYCKDEKNGGYISFNGNMSGMLIAEYIFRERQKAGTLPANGALVSTIVTTNMARAVAEHYGAVNIETLTGFKYIGEQIKLFEETGRYEYVFGLEESYGCLVGTHARDKDAVAAVAALAEIAAYCKCTGSTMWDEMLKVYEKFGCYREELRTITMKGMEGLAMINALMEKLRNDPPKIIGGLKVLKVRDYKKDEIRDCATGEITPTGLRRSNVLYFELENDSWCCARPSGTEPKIKFYMGVKKDSIKEADEALKQISEAVMALAE